MTVEKKSILVVGAGDATGGAKAKRFAREDFAAFSGTKHGARIGPAKHSCCAHAD